METFQNHTRQTKKAVKAKTGASSFDLISRFLTLCLTVVIQ